MTTLPQTTALRLPRPSSAAQISIPGAPGAVGFANPQPAIPTMTGADAWRVIRSNMWLIILLLIV